jgi:hypothetical protein
MAGVGKQTRGGGLGARARLRSQPQLSYVLTKAANKALAVFGG